MPKLVTLLRPAVIAGIVHYPSEGDLLVSDDEAAHLQENGFIDGAEDEPLPGDDGLDAMKVDDLKKVATDDGVDLTGLTAKADIIAAIRAKRATPPQA